MTLHTAFKKGTTVFLVYKDGTKAVDKFEDKKSKFIYFRDAGKVPVKDIRSLTIYRPDPDREEE